MNSRKAGVFVGVTVWVQHRAGSKEDTRQGNTGITWEYRVWECGEIEVAKGEYRWLKGTGG